MYLSYYKGLCRRVARLPLDHHSLEVARRTLKAQFTQSKSVPTYSVVDRKLYDRVISVLDDILIYEKYKDFDKLLNLVYRDLKPRPLWVEKFHHTRYGAFKKVWPQVHLMDEFGDSNRCKEYHDALAKMQPATEFLFLEAMQIPVNADLGSLSLLGRATSTDKVPQESELLKKLIVFHQFLKTHANALLDTQIHMLDVCYKPNRYGLPPSVAAMEAELKKKVNYAKHLLDSFKPIEKEDLLYLIEFTTSKREPLPEFNPNFFRYMLRKRAKEKNELSPAIQKYVRHKQLIPNERNLLHNYRQYVVRQFYVDEKGEYTISPMTNIYD
ncbi:hypothetical protein METBIDRAFT_43330 [Metschnikowia bicuspidata var. bicuspidata NRRL YB-4993]|uniref:Genetic interactor of prohibitin 5, mitochondrial n=1 Tax=Metschnikowia bicuspidata var. bicuspidata NRRL YB-4993 TaxID=869754 RepID=A0A1A0H8I0_9ASCO|nr:hypothetical protein METBIDRAFT_43330 [Metschnikowia bicuspidata var. bicuspidata NRRL YB-4993]OBA20192.1 hypothetical protein METBIDRAFT_43330 [Metschnikowia bicuspidata var. bicuspidata NRRL YB-4993]